MTQSDGILSSNEQKILTALSYNQSLSKARIAEIGSMSWATAVKMVHRLMERNIVEVAGKAKNAQKPGQKELLYRLNPLCPVAIGVDVEYSFTHIVLTNLRDELLAEHVLPTPQHPTAQSMQAFLELHVTAFIEEHVTAEHSLEGIGIGLPGVVIPAWIKPDTQENRRRLERDLHAVFGVPVAIEINVRSYTNYVKWHTPHFPGQDFALISVRTGVGMGIIIDGKPFVGHQSISGELGHIKVGDSGVRCRCGASGCLETFVNQYRLYQLYLERVLGLQIRKRPNQNDVEQGLAALFLAAADGNKEAVKILRETAHYIGRALASCLMMLFIPNIILCGHFGPSGDVVVPMIQEELDRDLLPSMKVDMVYEAFQRDRYAHGAALLILEHYLDYGSARASGPVTPKASQEIPVTIER